MPFRVLTTFRGPQRTSTGAATGRAGGGGGKMGSSTLCLFLVASSSSCPLSTSPASLLRLRFFGVWSASWGGDLHTAPITLSAQGGSGWHVACKSEKQCCASSDGMRSVPLAGPFPCGSVIPSVAIPVSGFQPVPAPLPAPVPSAAAPVSLPLSTVPVSVSFTVSVPMPVPELLMIPVMKPVPLSIGPVRPDLSPDLSPVAPFSIMSAFTVVPVSTHKTASAVSHSPGSPLQCSYSLALCGALHAASGRAAVRTAIVRRLIMRKFIPEHIECAWQACIQVHRLHWAAM